MESSQSRIVTDATYGVDGTKIPNKELSSPKMRIRSEDKAIEIPAGTPVGLIVQKCRGIPTYRLGVGYALTKLPREIKEQDRSQVRAIPSCSETFTTRTQYVRSNTFNKVVKQWTCVVSES